MRPQQQQGVYAAAMAVQQMAAALRRPMPGAGAQPTAGQPKTVPAPQTQAQPAGQAYSAIVVYSTAERDEIGIRTLVGEYKEDGSNHGRKCFKKSQKIPGHEDIEVYLYFWDERDGPSFSGWWFGNSVGGAQVWSRNRHCSLQPPKSGWTIPWDGDVKKELVVMDAAEKLAMDKAQAQAQMEGRRQEESDKQDDVRALDWEDRVQKATEKAADAEIDASEALESAKALAEGDADDAEILRAQRELAAQATALAETQRVIAVEALAAQKAPLALKNEMAALGLRLRKLQTKIKEALQALKDSKVTKAQRQQNEEKQAEEDARDRELEGVHSKQLEEMMPAAMEKVDAAEDEVEKVAIAAAPLQIDTGDDLRQVMLQAIKETESRARAAQAAIGEARRYISGKLTVVGRFVTSTKKTAVEEFTALQTRLTEAQEKLAPYKNVRQDYENRAQAKKLYEELSSQLAGAEIEVEKAAMMTAPLGGDTAEGIKETEMALSAAQSVLTQSTRLIDAKLKSIPGPLQDETKALQERGKLAQEKLDEVRKTVKETQVRIAADNLLREVAEKVSTAEDELQRMAEAELPFLRGDSKGQDLEAIITEADQVVARVHAALAEAQTFVAKKLVEVLRFTEGPARAVKEEIDMLQKRLEEGRQRLQQFRATTADRKRTHMLEEVEAKVAAAEGEIQKMTEATRSLGNLGTAGEAINDALTEMVEAANVAERAAQASIVVARKCLLQKTAELKKLAISGSGSGSELGKLQTRVNSMQHELSKMRGLTKDAEERVRVKQMLTEVAARMQTAEVEVEKVAAAAVPLAEEQPAADAVERMEKQTASAQTKLGTTAKLVDVKLKTAQGFLKEELQGMRSRITQAEKKLNDAIVAAKEQKERVEAAELVSQAADKIEKAEGDVQKTSDAELPFLKGIEVLSASDAQKFIDACEEAASQAQKSVADARTCLAQKFLDAKQLSEGSADNCAKKLLELQRRLDTGTSRLGELKKDTAERKRKAQMQASGEKIAGVEAAVQQLAGIMAKFPEEKLNEFDSEEAQRVCEEVADAEEKAQSAVSDARRFLALRVQDAKTFSESMRPAIAAELSKLQARLTQCQVELAKLSKQCTEREQRFVAQKLVRDATESLETLTVCVEVAGQVAAPLLAENTTDLTVSTCMQSMLVAIGARMKDSAASPEALFAEITTKKSATKEEFVAFLEKLPDAAGMEEASFTKEQAATIFGRVAGPGGQFSLADLRRLLRERLVCVARTPATDALDGGKEVGTVEVGEGVEVVEQKDGKAGNKRAKCVLARDGTTAWIALSDFKPSPLCVGKIDSIEAYVRAVHGRCSEAAAAVDQKAAEVATVKQGPLAEVRAKLLSIRTKVGQEQSKAEQLKVRSSAARAKLLQHVKEEVQKVQEVKCRALASESVKEATAAVGAAEQRAQRVVDSVKPGSAEALQKEMSIPELQAIKQATDGAIQALAEARAVVTRGLEAHTAYRGSLRSLLLEARVELTKLTSRIAASERKCKAATEASLTAYVKVVKTATSQARNTVRTAARALGKTPDELFAKCGAGSNRTLTEAQFTKFVGTLKEAKLTPEQVSLVYHEFGPHGLRMPGFAKLLQEFCKCEREIAVTQGFEIGSATTVRRLEKGELFEVLEGPKEDAENQLARVRGRAVRDGAAGWVTMKGNQGAPFLRPREKPFLWACAPAALVEKADDTSAVVRDLQTDEVLELLEGPRELVAGSELFLNGKASKDGAVGWIMLRDLVGTTYASTSKTLYVCKSTIAMTDVLELEKCKVLKKVEVGETLEMIGGEEQKTGADAAIVRLKFRSMSDGKEGWVTLRGNQGTVFVELSKSHYVVQKELTLRESSDGASGAVRRLEVGEAFEGEDAPKEVRPEPKMCLRARALEDGKTGWVSFIAGPQTTPVRPWVPKYTCKVTVTFTPALAAKGAEAVRTAEPGETFEAIEGPAYDASTGLRRVRCATAADGVIGWATLRGSDGRVLLEAA